MTAALRSDKARPARTTNIRDSNSETIHRSSRRQIYSAWTTLAIVRQDCPCLRQAGTRAATAKTVNDSGGGICHNSTTVIVAAGTYYTAEGGQNWISYAARSTSIIFRHVSLLDVSTSYAHKGDKCYLCQWVEMRPPVKDAPRAIGACSLNVKDVSASNVVAVVVSDELWLGAIRCSPDFGSTWAGSSLVVLNHTLPPALYVEKVSE